VQRYKKSPTPQQRAAEINDKKSKNSTPLVLSAKQKDGLCHINISKTYLNKNPSPWNF
jgi:hypothetical protein